MRFFKCLLPAILSMLINVNMSFASPIPLRGIVEGFYGTNWTFEDRANMLDFCRRSNLNAYIYAPKDDPYHRDKWREPYPSDKIREMKNLVDVAKKNNVRFVFAISPGLDLNYKGTKGDSDFQILIEKFDTMYNLGVRNFAIFMDDLKDKNGEHHEDGKLHANFLNRVQSELSRKYKDVAPLITVPTEYFRQDMTNGRKIKPYTEDFTKALNKNIIVLYTGDGVVCDGISDEQFEAANSIYGRELGIWWNYPVNDYSVTANGQRNAKLALGAIEKLPTKKVPAIFFNPMGQVELSKIAIATGAEYANSPDIYDSEKSFNRVIDDQFGDLATAMKIFAVHSRHMENGWAKCGAADAPSFQTESYLAINAFKRERDFDYSDLLHMIDEMENSADLLLKRLPRNILNECTAQLQQFKRIAQADRIAVQSLQNKKISPQLKNLREEISNQSVTAILSEQSALKFIDDVIETLQ